MAGSGLDFLTRRLVGARRRNQGFRPDGNCSVERQPRHFGCRPSENGVIRAMAAGRSDPQAQWTVALNRAARVFLPSGNEWHSNPASRRATLLSLLPRANWSTADRFERTAMSQICVANKTNVPDLEFSDFLGNGGIYEATD